MRKQCLPLINFGQELTGVRNEKLRSGILNGNLEELTSDWLGESVYENPEKDKLISDFLHSLNFTKEVVGETTIWWAKFNDIYVYFKLNPDLEFYEEDENGKLYIARYDGDLEFYAECEGDIQIKVLKEEGFTFEVKEEQAKSASKEEENSENINKIANHFAEVYAEELINNEVTSGMISEWWGMTCDQYGYSQENKDEVLEDIEKVIWNLI